MLANADVGAGPDVGAGLLPKDDCPKAEVPVAGGFDAAALLPAAAAPNADGALAKAEKAPPPLGAAGGFAKAEKPPLVPVLPNAPVAGLMNADG